MRKQSQKYNYLPFICFIYVSVQVHMPKWAVFFTFADSKSFLHNLLLQNVVEPIEYRIILVRPHKSSGGGSAPLDTSAVAGWATSLRLRWFFMLRNYLPNMETGDMLYRILNFAIYIQKWFIKQKSYFVEKCIHWIRSCGKLGTIVYTYGSL